MSYILLKIQLKIIKKILDIFDDPIDITKETYTGMSEPP